MQSSCAMPYLPQFSIWPLNVSVPQKRSCFAISSTAYLQATRSEHWLAPILLPTNFGREVIDPDIGFRLGFRGILYKYLFPPSRLLVQVDLVHSLF